MGFESLLGSSGEHGYSHNLNRSNRSPSVREVILFDYAPRLRRDLHGVVREVGDTCVARQIRQIYGVTVVSSHTVCKFLSIAPNTQLVNIS